MNEFDRKRKELDLKEKVHNEVKEFLGDINISVIIGMKKPFITIDSDRDIARVVLNKLEPSTNERKIESATSVLATLNIPYQIVVGNSVHSRDPNIQIKFQWRDYEIWLKLKNKDIISNFLAKKEAEMTISEKHSLEINPYRPAKKILYKIAGDSIEFHGGYFYCKDEKMTMDIINMLKE